VPLPPSSAVAVADPSISAKLDRDPLDRSRWVDTSDQTIQRPDPSGDAGDVIGFAPSVSAAPALAPRVVVARYAFPYGA
jgi:hypothetical protein